MKRRLLTHTEQVAALLDALCMRLSTLELNEAEVFYPVADKLRTDFGRATGKSFASLSGGPGGEVRLFVAKLEVDDDDLRN